MSGSGSPRPRTGLVSGWLEGEAGWGVSGFNPNFDLLDSLVNLTIRNPTFAPINTPPAAPVEGDVYFTSTNNLDAFSGQSNKLALWTRGVWRFITPRHGWVATIGQAPPRLHVFVSTNAFGAGQWMPLVPKGVPPYFLHFYIPGTPAADTVIYRFATGLRQWPTGRGAAFTADHAWTIDAASSIRAYTRPSGADVATVRLRVTADSSGGTPGETIGTFTQGSGTVVSTFTPTLDGNGDPIQLGSHRNVDVVLIGSGNGLTDISFRLMLVPPLGLDVRHVTPPAWSPSDSWPPFPPWEW